MHPHFNNNNLVLWLLCIHRVMDVHPLLDASTNQFMGDKTSRDLCLRCNRDACMDSLAGQKAILKVEVLCPREMPLQFNCCMPSCTEKKNIGQRDLCNILRFQDAKLTLTSFYLIFFKPIQSLQTYISMASLNHQYASMRFYFMELADDARKFLDWNCMTLVAVFLNIIKLLIF